nr:MAG TPA: hypothetical protein [Caudoviricetes sp.]
MLLIGTAKPNRVFTSGCKNQRIRKFDPGFYGIFLNENHCSMRNSLGDRQHLKIQGCQKLLDEVLFPFVTGSLQQFHVIDCRDVSILIIVNCFGSLRRTVKSQNQNISIKQHLHYLGSRSFST